MVVLVSAVENNAWEQVLKREAHSQYIYAHVYIYIHMYSMYIYGKCVSLDSQLFQRDFYFFNLIKQDAK